MAGVLHRSSQETSQDYLAHLVVKNFISAEEQRRAQLESAASTHTTPAVLDSMRLPESTVMRRRKASSSYLYKYQENVNFIVFQRIDFVPLLPIFLYSVVGFFMVPEQLGPTVTEIGEEIRPWC